MTGDTGGDRGYRRRQGIQGIQETTGDTGVAGDTGGDRGYRS